MLASWMRRLRPRTVLGPLALAIASCTVAFAIAQDVSPIVIDPGAPVYAETCKACHAEIGEGDNPLVEFGHAPHMVYACSSCHQTFPHTPAGTIVPDMRSCWDCHGLRHGPMGLIAGYGCAQCHGANVGRMRPESHTRDWAGVPHVEPALAELRTSCAMCHTREQCDSCHEREEVVWRPTTPFTYDVGDGCLACHGNENLMKASADGAKSYYVSGIDESAHRDLTCTQCHTDFNHTDEPAPTPLWRVNAGLACQDCHDHREVAAAYAESLHGQLIAQGDYSSATCASCHGGHDIARLDTAAAQRELHSSAERMCAGCHREAYDSYSDYYHGAPYKAGVADAPACWQCHGAHEIRAVADPESLMYPANAVATCGQAGCHYGSGESFVEEGLGLIHGIAEVRAENPVLRWWNSLRDGR